MSAVSQTLNAAAHCVDQGDLDHAEMLARQVLEGDELNPGALHILGTVARRTHRVKLAIEMLTRAIEHGARLAPVYFELGVALRMDEHWEAAAGAFQQATRLDPSMQAAHVNLAAMQERMENFTDAVPIYRQAVEMEPDCPITRFNLANALWMMGELEEACLQFDTALVLDPTHAKARWNSACCHLLAGKFERGWQDYEWRDAAEEVSLDMYPHPRWHGESLDKKCIVVHGEQGIGDEILFASCLPELIAQSAHCVVVCDPRLKTLFARSFPAASVHGIARRKDLAAPQLPEKIDVQSPAGSLPQFLRPTRESFPRRQRFLLAEPKARHAWRQRFDALGPGLKIGISWRAGGQPSERRKRTTTLDQWLPLISVPGVHWINLQYGESVDEVAACRQQHGVPIHDFAEGDPLVDLDGFAAKMAALDLVISVGNATVHMAGALGVPAWNLLPKVPGWRWGLTGEQSLWYPSVRLIRQTQRGEWANVFADVRDRLQKHLLALGCVMPAASAPVQTTPAVPLANPATATNLGRLTNIDATMHAAAGLYHSGDIEQAENLCREVLAHAPRNANALHLLGVLARQTHRLDLAIRSLSHAVAVWDKDASMHLNLASALHDAGRLDDAVEAYRRVIEIKPEMAAAHLSLGNALLALHRTDEAIESYQTVVRLEPNSAKVYNALGVAHLEQKNWPMAESMFRKAIKLRPDYMAAHNNLGQALLQLDRWEDAICSFQRALEIDDKSFQAMLNLARVYAQQEQRESALRLYRRALALRPGHEPTTTEMQQLLGQMDASSPLGLMPQSRAASV